MKNDWELIYNSSTSFCIKEFMWDWPSGESKVFFFPFLCVLLYTAAFVHICIPTNIFHMPQWDMKRAKMRKDGMSRRHWDYFWKVMLWDTKAAGFQDGLCFQSRWCNCSEVKFAVHWKYCGVCLARLDCLVAGGEGNLFRNSEKRKSWKGRKSGGTWCNRGGWKG